MKRLIATVAACAAVCLCTGASSTSMDDAAGFRPARKKFIASGHQFGLATSLSNLLENVAAFDETAIDGAVVHLNAPLPDGKLATTYMTLRDPKPWPSDVFAPEVPRLRELMRHPAFNTVFVRGFGMPRKRIDWKDDAIWAVYAGHLRAIARAAKAGGAKGFLADHEDYFGAKQFLVKKGEGTWEEMASIARRRGRELFQPVFEEFPGAEIFFYRFLVADPGFWNSYSTAADPVAAMKAKGDLWPAFANGIFDVMPWAAKIVEGDETGYRYESKLNWFYFARNLQRNGALRLVAPEHRDKYRARVSTAFPVYLDAYTDDCFKPGSQYYRGAVEGARAVHLERNLAQAADAADEYVWLYGEKRAWVHFKGALDRRVLTDRTWPEMFPGINDVLRAKKDPEGFLADCLRHPERYENAFKGAVHHSPWRRVKGCRAGEFVAERDGFRATGVEDGCFQCVVPAKCGEYYAVSFAVKNVSSDWARAWHGSSEKDLNKWLIPGYTVPLSAPDADGWRRGAVLMRVPDFGSSVEFTAGVHLAEGESAWLRDVKFLKVIPLLKDGQPSARAEN